MFSATVPQKDIRPAAPFRCFAQGIHGYVPDVYAVYGYGALGHVVKTRYKTCDSGLSAAARTDKRDDFSLVYCEIELVQHLFAVFGVGKSDVVETHVALYVLQLCGVLLVGGGYGGIHNLLIAFERGYAPFKLFGVVGKGYEGRHKHRSVQQIRDEQSRVYLEQSAEYKYKDVHNRVHASERREKTPM